MTDVQLEHVVSDRMWLRSRGPKIFDTALNERVYSKVLCCSLMDDI